MLELDQRQTIIVAILVLFLGKALNKQLTFLREYNIPEPVTGGMLASIFIGVIYASSGITIDFELAGRDQFLIIFFTCVGLNARFASLLKGGYALVILLVLAIVYLVLQNTTGLLVGQLSSSGSAVGLLGGSVSLSGGHGTAIAWADIFESKFSITNAIEIGIACATFGLIFGGIIGGPIAKFLIKRYQLNPADSAVVSLGGEYSQGERIHIDTVLHCILVISIAIGIGLQLNQILLSFGLILPEFVTSLFAGIILTNTVPYVFNKWSWPSGTRSLSLVSELSLGLFLAMSLMSLQLWSLLELAVPILVILLAQVFVITIFVIFVVFKLLGKDYDAAVIAAGYAGLGLGATPTAIANMNAVTERFGPSEKAFIVVPLVGAFFIDIANTFVIQFFISVL